MLDINQTLYNTDYNYQKIALKGEVTATITNTTFPSAVTQTITHNLGAITSARIWYDPALGKRFPISLNQFVDDSSFTSQVNLEAATAYLTSNTLVIEFFNASGSPKSVTYWYRVYYDS